MIEAGVDAGHRDLIREVIKDAAGEVVELRCTYGPATRGGDAPDGLSGDLEN